MQGQSLAHILLEEPYRLQLGYLFLYYSSIWRRGFPRKFAFCLVLSNLKPFCWTFSVFWFFFPERRLSAPFQICVCVCACVLASLCFKRAGFSNIHVMPHRPIAISELFLPQSQGCFFHRKEKVISIIIFCCWPLHLPHYHIVTVVFARQSILEDFHVVLCFLIKKTFFLTPLFLFLYLLEQQNLEALLC